MATHIRETRRINQVTEPIPYPSWGEFFLQPDTYFLLHIGMDRQHLIVPPRKDILVGRVDQHSEQMPDIDLAAYGGVEQGVSRLHARLDTRFSRVTVTDLGSSNGTWLNGWKVNAYRPCLVRAGDDIRFGTLVVYIYFMQLRDRNKPVNKP